MAEHLSQDTKLDQRAKNSRSRRVVREGCGEGFMGFLLGSEGGIVVVVIL